MFAALCMAPLYKEALRGTPDGAPQKRGFIDTSTMGGLLGSVTQAGNDSWLCHPEGGHPALVALAWYSPRLVRTGHLKLACPRSPCPAHWTVRVCGGVHGGVECDALEPITVEPPDLRIEPVIGQDEINLLEPTH
jgi:hypothetical protein